jgi:hypothetical protein
VAPGMVCLSPRLSLSSTGRSALAEKCGCQMGGRNPSQRPDGPANAARRREH